MHDWNHDGKKNGIDNFIEYQIYKNTTTNDTTNNPDNHINKNSSSQKSMSTVAALLCIISGLLWQVLLFTALDVNIENVPSFVIIVLWVVFSMITTGVVVAISKK